MNFKQMKYLPIVILLIAANSCSKTTEDINLSYDVPVVSGFLSPNNIPRIQISELILFDNDTSDTENNMLGLEVYLSHNNNNYQLISVDDRPGRYQCTDTLFQVESGEEYLLEFMYKDIPISSKTKVPFKPENFETSTTTIALPRITEESNGGGPGTISSSLELNWDNPDNGYYLVTYQYLEDEYNPVNETIEIEHPEDFANITSTPIQDSMYSIIGRQFSYFGHYNLILFKITDEYAAIYESLNQSSLDDLSEPITNIINGKGIFAAFNSDTLQINVVVD